MHEPGIVELSQRIRLVGDPELTKVWPVERKATVEVRTLDGHAYTRTSDRAPGTPDHPMSGPEVVAKFIGLVESVVGRDQAHRASDALLRLDTVRDIGEPLALLSRRVRS
jgi:2-methylcitrate dehydratase